MLINSNIYLIIKCRDNPDSLTANHFIPNFSSHVNRNTLFDVPSQLQKWKNKNKQFTLARAYIKAEAGLLCDAFWFKISGGLVFTELNVNIFTCLGEKIWRSSQFLIVLIQYSFALEQSLSELKLNRRCLINKQLKKQVRECMPKHQN